MSLGDNRSVKRLLCIRNTAKEQVESTMSKGKAKSTLPRTVTCPNGNKRPASMSNTHSHDEGKRPRAGATKTRKNQNVAERGSFQPEALAIHKCIPQQPLQLLSRAVAVQSEGVEAGPCDRIPGAVVSEARKPKRQAGGAHRGNPVTTSHKRENLPLDLGRGTLEEVPEPFHHCNCLGSLRGPIIVGSHSP